MKNDEIEKRHNDTFQDIRNVAKDGEEFWLARDLQLVLEYAEWRNFELVIRKAASACKESGYNPTDHFVAINKKVVLGSGAVREIDDFELSRYAGPKEQH